MYVEAYGFAGGIWILWSNACVQLEVLSINDQFVNVLIHRHLRDIWFLTTVYASPEAHYRSELWRYVERLGNIVSILWLMLGDFNQVLHSDEKKSGTPMHPRKIQAFHNMIMNFALVDMGYSGSPFTWTNLRAGLANIQQRLDRALCNLQWLTKFPGYHVLHLPRTRSDHSPLLVREQL